MIWISIYIIHPFIKYTYILFLNILYNGLIESIISSIAFNLIIGEHGECKKIK